MQISVERWANLDDRRRRQLLSRSESGIRSLKERVASIVSDVETHGDEALRRLTLEFDSVDLSDLPIRVTEHEFDKAEQALERPVREALDYAIANVEEVHRGQQHAPQSIEVRPDVVASERHVPIDSVGLYVPRGRGSFPSMLYMLAVPAAIAGVPRMVVATPPGATGTVDAACLYAARRCGVHEVVRVGGAQAVAALAYGTESVAPVNKIVGPGSAYVAAAKRVVRDAVDVGLPAGPSESMIVADDSADAFTVCLDLLIEAEHGGDSQAVLVTTSHALANDVAGRLPELIESTPQPRRDFLTEGFGRFGGVLLVSNAAEAARVVNEFAPEHLQVRLTDAHAFVERIKNAGEILIGPFTPFSLANYAIGANAVLPTGGGARVHSGVSVHDFQKLVAVMEVRQSGFAEIGKHVMTLAEYEGFHWHARAIRSRLDLKS